MRQDPKFRTVITYKNYFEDFFNTQTIRVKEKILWTIELIEDIEIVPTKFLKCIRNTNGLYEIRVKVGSNIFRIFCFFDNEQLVLLINSFQKKSQKTPKSQINKAIEIKEEYERSKK